MSMVKHIININNRSKNSQWYLIDRGQDGIIAESKKNEKKTFHSKEEFLTWFKSYSVNSIRNRIFLR